MLKGGDTNKLWRAAMHIPGGSVSLHTGHVTSSGHVHLPAVMMQQCSVITVSRSNFSLYI